MPLGSAPTSTIDIDFTRAQGVNSSGRITFAPPRIRIGTTMLSPYKIIVPVVNGVATQILARLPAGTYHVIEEIDGRPPYEFNFALPTDAAATIQYEDIAPVDVVPLVYTVVRTINGVAPNPTTGDIIIETGAGASDLDGLTDVTVVTPMNGQSLVYDSLSAKWKNLLLTAADVGASPASHTHSVEIDDVFGLEAILDDKQPLDSDLTAIAGLAPADNDVLQRIAGVWANRTLSQLKTSLSLSKNDVGLSEVDNTSDVDKPVSTAQATAIAERILPPRILRVKDKSKEGAGNTYDLPNTSDAWALFGGAGPSEYTIQARVGDDVSVYYDFLMQIHVTSFFDFAVVTGGTPTIQRYLSSGSSTPSFNGPSGSYPSNEQFQGVNGMLGFSVEAGDLDSGNVRLQWVIKTSTTTGKIYANNNYPLTVRVVNTRLSGI